MPKAIKSVLLGVAGILGFAAESAGAAEPAVAFGARYAVALRSNGDVLTWGDNIRCELGRSTPVNSGVTPTLVMRNAVEIAVASDHTLVLSSDGKVYGSGINAESPLGTGRTQDECEGPALIQPLADKNIVHIATGYGFSVAVSKNGDLYCAGDNSVGQCPVSKSHRIDVFSPVPFPELAGNVAAVRAGAFHTLALTRDGRLFAFGRNREGQLGTGGTAATAGFVAGLNHTVSFSAGTWHSVAVQEDGTVWTWGSNLKSQLCDGATNNRAVPTKISSLSSPAKIVEVAAGGHSTLMKSPDGSLYACGDNWLGQLGVDQQPTVPQPTKVSAPPAKGPVLSVAINNSAFAQDACSLRIAGYNEYTVVHGRGDSAPVKTFMARDDLSLCAPSAAAPLPNIVHEAPQGGPSNCWTTRAEADGAAEPKWAPLRRAMLAAEDIVRRNAAFTAAPEPVRMRPGISAGPYAESGARLHILAVAERQARGIRVWTTGCEVIPQVDRIGGAIGAVSVFINTDARDTFLGSHGEGPKLTGRVAGYPEYNNWVILTKDGRLPWIPQTLQDVLDAEGARREQKLKDWLQSISSIKAPDPASVQKTYETLKKTDPAGADRYLASMKEQGAQIEHNHRTVYPASTAAFEKAVSDYKQYRASFSAEALRSPAVWGDPTGEGKRRLDAQVAELNKLSADEQRQADEWGRQARDLDRQAQVEGAKNHDAEAAARLRAAANELAQKVRALRAVHQENAAPLITGAEAQYQLTNLKPGDREKAMSFKPDPAFPDPKQPNRIQVIMISFNFADTRNPEHPAWGQRTRDTFDFASLAALLQ